MLYNIVDKKTGFLILRIQFTDKKIRDAFLKKYKKQKFVNVVEVK